MISEAWADLGGGIATAHGQVGHLPHLPGRPDDADASPAPPHNHMYNPVSGWCGCGLRDDGQVAEGSPAWRERITRIMP